MTLERDGVVRDVSIKDGIGDSRAPIRPQEAAEGHAIRVCGEQESRQHLTAICPLTRVDCSIYERVESLIQRQRDPEGHLAILTAVQACVSTYRVSVFGHVTPRTYLGCMSVRGLSDLLVTMMVAGRVGALDVHRTRPAHQALATLRRSDSLEARAVIARFGVQIDFKPDPDVGLRVAGLTRATWQAVSDGALEPHEEQRRGWYLVTEAGRERALRLLRRMPSQEADVLYRVGAVWATASTARKYSETAVRVGSIRLVSRA